MADCEEWRVVPGWEDYIVSSWGNVKSVRYDRTLSQSNGGWNLYKSVEFTVNGKRKRFTVHKLVALAFIGPCPEGMVVNHIDLHKDNNRADNLEYVTRDGNNKHAAMMGATPSGQRHWAASITDDTARLIRRLRAEGYLLTEIAEETGASISVVSSVARGDSWKNVR